MVSEFFLSFGSGSKLILQASLGTELIYRFGLGCEIILRSNLMSELILGFGLGFHGSITYVTDNV